MNNHNTRPGSPATARRFRWLGVLRFLVLATILVSAICAFLVAVVTVTGLVIQSPPSR